MNRSATNLRLHQVRVSHRTTWEVIELMAPSGAIGIGECSDSLDVDQLPQIVADLVADLASVWPDDPEGACAGEQGMTVVRAIDGRLDAFAAAADDPRVRHVRRVAAGGVVSALADLAARAEGVSVAQWLARFGPAGSAASSGDSGASRPVTVYANINRSPRERVPDEFARVAVEAVAAGFSSIKLAPFDGPVLEGSTLVETGLAHIAAVRAAVGDGAEVLIDLHHKLSHDELASALPEFEALRAGWLEDAVSVHDAEELAWLDQATDLPLAGGERLTEVDEIAKVVGSGHLDWLLLDIKFIGGPVRFARLVDAVGDTRLSLHDPTGPVATAHSLHATVLQRPPALLEYAYGEPIDRAALIDPAEHVANGEATRPTGAGLGVRLADGQWGEDTLIGSWEL